MRNSNLHLQFIKQIKVVITDVNGQDHVITMNPDEIVKRTNNVLYQTFSNAVGFEMERKVEEVCYQNLPEHEVFDGVRDGSIAFKEYISVSESWDKKFYFCLKVSGETKRFEFKTKEEAENVLRLAEGLFNYLRHKKK